MTNPLADTAIAAIAAKGSIDDRRMQDLISYGTAVETPLVTVTTMTGSAVLAVATALANRKTVSLKTPGKDGAGSGGNSGIVWIGFTNTVAVNAGWPLEPGAAIDIEANPQVTIFAIGTSGDKLAVMEIAGSPIV